MPSAVCPACDTRFNPTLAACPACGAVPFRPPDDRPAVDWHAIHARRARLKRFGLAVGLVAGGLANWVFFATGGGGWLSTILVTAYGLSFGAAVGLIAWIASELTPVRRYGDGKPPRGPRNPFAD